MNLVQTMNDSDNYKWLADSARAKASSSNLKNVREVFLRSAENWERLANEEILYGIDRKTKKRRLSIRN